MCKEEEFIRPENAQVGDLIVLTKPLGKKNISNLKGTQVAVNLYECKKNIKLGLLTNKERFNNVKDIISEEEIIESYCKATESMVHLNKTAAELMHKYKSNGATGYFSIIIL
jgi:selenide,water dikinase